MNKSQKPQARSTLITNNGWTWYYYPWRRVEVYDYWDWWKRIQQWCRDMGKICVLPKIGRRYVKLSAISKKSHSANSSLQEKIAKNTISASSITLHYIELLTFFHQHHRQVIRLSFRTHLLVTRPLHSSHTWWDLTVGNPLTVKRKRFWITGSAELVE